MPKTMNFEEKVAAGFEEAGGRMDEIDGRISETTDAVKSLEKQIRRYAAAFMTGETPEGKAYQSFWPTEEHAKDFARLFLVAAGKMSPSKLSKDLSEGIGSAGGVLVPDEMMKILIDLLGRYGKFRANAMRIPMGSATLKVPRVTSDLSIYCPGESVAPSKSAPSFSGVSLTPRTFVALVAISSEVDEDSLIGIGEILGHSFTRSMAKQEDLIGFLGDGTAAYFGMTGIIGQFLKISDTMSSIAGLKIQTTPGTFAAITLGDFEATAALLPEEFDENAKWYVSKRFFWNAMHRVAASEGIANMFEILSGRKEKSFLGYPVEFVSAMPSAVAASDKIVALLGDLKLGAYLGERRELRIERSEHVYFAEGQIGFRATERIDVNCFGVGDLTNPGPIVGLVNDIA